MTSILCTFSFPLEKKVLMDEFKKIADREGKNHSRLVIELVEQYVKYHSEGNNTFPITKWVSEPDFQAIPSLDSPMDKWTQCYRNSNEKERTELRIKAMNLQKWFRMVDINE